MALEQDLSEEEKKEVELTEVVTQTAQAFKLPDGTILDVNGYLTWIGNQIIGLRKALG